MKEDQDPRDSGSRMSRSLKKRAESSRSLGLAALIPTMMWVGPVVGFLLGRWLEGYIGHAPWPGAIGMVLGAVAGVRQIVKLLRQSKNNSR